MIGAGVAGLSCARQLARHGLDTVVLERGTVAGGASGRNGGFLLAGPAAFYPDAREKYGHERARTIYARTLETQAEMYALAEDLGVGDVVRRVGLLRVSASEDEAEHVRRHAETLREDGFPGELFEHPVASRRPSAALPTTACSPTTTAPCTRRAGSGRWRGDAESAGARIHEDTPVELPVPAPSEGDLRHAGRQRRVPATWS